MNILYYVEFHDVVVLSVLCSVLCCVIWKKRSSKSIIIPTNWPLIGMLPGVLQNVGRIHDYATEALRHSGGTVRFKGPWFANMDMLITCDPANIDHILRKNFKNYPKGPHFQKIFGFLGDGITNVDSELWELHRKTTTPLMNHANFRTLLETNLSQKIEGEIGLLAVLDHYAQQGVHFDLQDIFRRVTFDISCLQFLDKDPGSLCIDPPVGNHPFCKALRDTVNAILYRHLLPEWCWKLQKWVVGVDREKKLSEAGKAFDLLLYPILLERIDQLNKNKNKNNNFSMLTSHIEAHPGKSIQFLRDTFLTFIIAGSDTNGSAITWFFWRLANNPLVESNILHEILQLKRSLVQQGKTFKVQEFQKLVYLHAAFCESLRLFPSVPLNHKIPMEKDVLPSGHVVSPNTKIIMSFYSMGKMEAIWGADYMEFKPERWISPNGGIKHQPPHKFPAFNAGPRTCMGRDMAFTVLKMVAASIICHYHCELVDDGFHPLQITDSILFEMRHGLKVKLNKLT